VGLFAPFALFFATFVVKSLVRAQETEVEGRNVASQTKKGPENIASGP
jgi:hypothetical protein